jgi:hypothetical protein
MKVEGGLLEKRKGIREQRGRIKIGNGGGKCNQNTFLYL